MDKHSDRKLNILSLCSGGGGLDLGLELALGCTRTVVWVEWNSFAIAFLVESMAKKILHSAPVWTDLKTFDGNPWRGKVDCIIGGYPCQPFSLAGKRLGSADPRHLYPSISRIISEIKPSLLFFENVSGHVSLGYEQVEEDLYRLGYTVTPGLFTAEEVGATHRRERLFILAVANSCYESGDEQQKLRVGKMGTVQESRKFSYSGSRGEVANERSPGEVPISQDFGLFPPSPIDDFDGIPKFLLPAVEPLVCKLVDGISDHRSSYLRILGNAVCPLAAAYAFLSLWSIARLDFSL